MFIERARSAAPGAAAQLAQGIAARYGIPAAEVERRLAIGRFRVKGNNKNSTYTSRGDFMKFEYDYASGTSPMAAVASMDFAAAGNEGSSGAAPALSGDPGSEVWHRDREREAAMSPQAALRGVQAIPSRDGASLTWTVGANDHVDGFNIYRETTDRMLVFAGNEAGLHVVGDEVEFH